MYLRFQSLEKWANLQLPLNVQKPKMLQLQGASPLWPLTRGSASGSRWGLCPQTPVIGSRYHARHGAVPPKFCGLEPPLFCGIQLLREKPRLT